MKSSSKHWNSIFSGIEDSKLGWFEKDASQTFKLLYNIPKSENTTVFLPGAGTSVLIEELLIKNFKLVLNDISVEAFNKVKTRLENKYQDVIWICQDIAQPLQGINQKIDIWIDRAVLHFLTDESDIKGYFENIQSVLKIGGHVIFAEFSKTGAPKCAGLTLHRYSVEELSTRLGTSFKLMSHFDHVYINHNGDPRAYIYALYRKDQRQT